MSYISDITLLDAWPEDVERINSWLREHDDRQQQIKAVKGMDDLVVGGNKVYCTKVWAAAMNYMPHDLLDVLRDPATWKYPCMWTVETEGELYYAGIVTFARNGGTKVTHIEARDDD